MDIPLLNVMYRLETLIGQRWYYDSDTIYYVSNTYEEAQTTLNSIVRDFPSAYIDQVDETLVYVIIPNENI